MTIPPGAGLGQRIVIDGFRGAIFEYDVNNNLIGSWASASGTDPYGNAYPAGFDLTAASINGMIQIIISIAGGSEIILNPNVNQQFNITTLISGIIQAAAQFVTTDVNEIAHGALGSVLLNTGTATKMSTVLMSPFGNTGTALVLESENDGATDTPVITLGTTTTQDAGTTIVFAPILTIGPFYLLLYSGQSGQTVVTKTSGSGTIPIPVGVSTALAECWGSSGGGGILGNFGGGGAGGGEYAAEPALAVTSGGTVSYVVGAAGTGGVQGGAASTSGASSTLTGTSATVTAHGGITAG